jgi:hypothetical protein
MKEYFDGLEVIECAEFFGRFRKHINNRVSEDRHEKDILQGLYDVRGYMRCYLGILKEEGLKHIILPHHTHSPLEHGREPDRPTKLGGECLDKVASDFGERFIPENRFMPCSEKIQALRQREDFFNASDSVFKADFLFVCNRWEYAHPRGDEYRDHGEGKLYIGNGYHRFIAYRLWILENKLFKPLQLHYVELPLTLEEPTSASPNWRV